MIIYYSGTGNSKFCAFRLMDAIKDSVQDATPYIREKKKGSFSSEKPFVFVCPTYAWQLPRIFEKFIDDCDFSGNLDAYFIMTCGDSVGNAGKYIEALCKKNGLNYKGVYPIIMPENYIAMYSAPNEDEQLKILARANDFIEEVAFYINNGKNIDKINVTLVDKIYSSLVNKMFYKFCVKAKDFYVTDSCTSCGKCAKLCPLGNIELKDGKPVWGDECTHCMACICACPCVAIEYGKHTKGLRRYYIG